MILGKFSWPFSCGCKLIINIFLSLKVNIVSIKLLGFCHLLVTLIDQCVLRHSFCRFCNTVNLGSVLFFQAENACYE